MGFIGIPCQNVLKEYDINRAPIICDISMEYLREIWKNSNFYYQSPPQFPSVSRDIALQVPKGVPSETLFHTIKTNGGDYLKNVFLFDVYQSKNVGEENKSLAFSLKFQSNTNTLKDYDVDQIVANIINSLQDNHGANQR